MWACVCGEWHHELGPLDPDQHVPADEAEDLLPTALGTLGWDR